MSDDPRGMLRIFTGRSDHMAPPVVMMTGKRTR
jgi:hypothetical protein